LSFKSVLQAGPVPRLFLVNHESRREGLRKYNLVASHVPHTTTKPILTFHHPKTRKIYIDLAHDTFYFVSFCGTHDFVKWLRNFTNESIGGARRGIGKIKTKGIQDCEAMTFLGIGACDRGEKPEGNFETLARGTPKPGISHIAFSAKNLLQLEEKGWLYFLLRVVMIQTSLKTIGIVLDRSTFERHKSPQNYELTIAGPGKPGNKWNCWSSKANRKRLERVFDDFWTSKWDTMAWESTREKYLKEWRRWVEKHPEWKGPEFPMFTLAAVSGNVL
jgi:hypothetical protein